MSTITDQKPPTVAQRTAQAAEKSARYLDLPDAKLLGAVLAEVAADELRHNRTFADRVQAAYQAAAPKPKQPRPKTTTSKASKPKVTLVPINDVGPHMIDIAGVVDPFYLYEVFGAKQLPLALDNFSKGKLLDEVVPIVLKRHPGPLPAKSATKQSVIAFIVQRVVND